jgi:hypothetical protein
MKTSDITFNQASKRYEMDGKELTSGTTLSLWFDLEWHSARIKYSDKFEYGYYAIVFPNNGKPYTVDLDFACWGTFEKYDFESEEVQSLFKDIVTITKSLNVKATCWELWL